MTIRFLQKPKTECVQIYTSFEAVALMLFGVITHYESCLAV